MPRKRLPKRKERMPVSLEQEHKLIHGALKEANDSLKHYQDECKNLKISTEQCDTEAFTAWCKELVSYWEIDDGELEDVGTFRKLCEQNRIDRIHQSKDEYVKITDLCEQFSKFMKVVPVAKRHLTTAVRNHLFKYCVSFSKDLDAGECKLNLATEYDQSIVEWRTLLSEYLDQVRELLEDISERSKPFMEFISNSKTLCELMESTVENLKKCSHVAREWVRRDHEYARELHDSMLYEQRARDKEKNKIPLLNKRLDQTNKELRKKTTELEKAMKDLKPKKRQKAKIKQSLETIEKSKDRNREEILVTEEELSKVKLKMEALEKRPHCSDPELKNYFRILGPIPELKNQMEGIRDWLLKLDGNDKAYTRQTMRLTKERKQLSGSIYEDEIHITELETAKRDVEKVVTEIVDDIRYIEIEIEAHEQKLHQLTKLHDIKLSPDSLRKIYYRKRWNQTKENDEAMMKACDFVSEQIGEEWKQLYVKLPFLPKRAMPKRRNDVEVLDVIYASPRNDATWTTEAKKSLERWRLLHRRGKVEDLVTSLKKSGKECLADQLKESFVSG